jgi:hypothetical protein
LARRVEQREHGNLAVQLRVVLEQALERAETPDDVLRRIGAIDPEDELLRAVLQELPLQLKDLGARRELVELRGVDRDRMVGREHSATVVLGGAVLEVALGVDDVHAGAEEVLAPAVGMEADDVVCQQAVVEGNADRFRQHAPVVRFGPRDVHEV